MKLSPKCVKTNNKIHAQVSSEIVLFSFSYFCAVVRKCCARYSRLWKLLCACLKRRLFRDESLWNLETCVTNNSGKKLFATFIYNERKREKEEESEREIVRERAYLYVHIRCNTKHTYNMLLIPLYSFLHLLGYICLSKPLLNYHITSIGIEWLETIPWPRSSCEFLSIFFPKKKACVVYLNTI